MPNIFEFEERDIASAVVRELSPRDFRSSVTPTPTQRTTLIVAGVYIIAIAILWYVLHNPMIS